MWTPDPSIIITADQRAAEASAQAWAAFRGERDRRIAKLDWVIAQKMEQESLGIPLTLTPELFDAVFVYRQALRDLPNSTVDPEFPIWPDEPSL